MRKRVVYTVTTAGNDCYSAMTQISLCSLRITNPSVEIIVACDRESFVRMREDSDHLLNLADSVLPIDTPNGKPTFRNRHVKTRVRECVEGDFLHLDSDVLVRSQLDAIFETPSDVALALNHSTESADEQICPDDLVILAKMNWRIEGPYFNGGVIFWRDTDSARELSRAWHQNWSATSDSFGTFRDQPALNRSIFLSDAAVTRLQDKYNAQIMANPRSAANAVIWHYYLSMSDDVPLSDFEYAVAQQIASLSGPEDVARALLQSKSPWRQGRFLSGYIGSRINRRRELALGDKLLLQRKWVDAAYYFLLRRFVDFESTATGLQKPPE